jgi:raffinose/stachyose/melibiose transport system substrate-binding protein
LGQPAPNKLGEKLIKKLIAAAAVAGLAVSLTACAPAGDSAANCETKTEVTWLGTIKTEIQDQFLATLDDYNASQSCYEIVTVQSEGDSLLANLTTLYAAGEAPVVMTMLQELPDMQDKLMDFNETELVAKVADPGLLTAANKGGKQIGIPVTAEAFGLLYNKAVLDAAGVDPAAITTRSELETAFKAVEASGKKAIHFSGLWWSLGAHLTNKYFTTVSEDHEARLANLDGLADGTVDLDKDVVFQNWLDTFDLLKKYDINGGKSIADSDYDDAVLDLGKGDVGFWFMGNWAEPNLLQTDAAGSFGIMPLPISDEAGAYGNDAISVGVPFYFTIDAEQSTEEERAGAIDFLTWLTGTPEGQTHYAGSIEDDNMSFIPVYKDFTVEPNTFMAQEIAKYISNAKTLEWMNSYYPAGGQNLYGDAGQKYITGKTSRAQFATELEKAWKGVEKTWR